MTIDLTAAGRLAPAEVLERLGSTDSGLTSTQAEERLRTLGPNVLVTHRVTALGVLVRQLRNPLLILLLAAAAVSGLTGDPTDTVIIATIVVLSIGLGSSTSTGRSGRSRRCTATSATRRSYGATAPSGASTFDISSRATSSCWGSVTWSRRTCGCWRRRSWSATRRC